MTDEIPQHAARSRASARAQYDERLQRFVHEARDLTVRDRRISWLRLAFFLVAVGALAVTFWGSPTQPGVWYGACAASLLAFLILIWRHSTVASQQRRVSAHVRMNTEALHRIARTWEALPPADPLVQHENVPLARDLSLFGHASLFQLLGNPGTQHGRRTLARWLLTPADAREITERQRAIDELAPLLDLRQELAWRAGVAGRLDPEPFLEWAEGASWLSGRLWILWAARLLPFCIAGFAIAQYVGAIDSPVWALFIVITITLSLSVGESIHAVFDRVASREGRLSAFEAPMSIVASTTFVSERLRELQARLMEGGISAHRRMRMLSRLVELAGLHHSQMTYLPIQALTMWDVHVLDALERWQSHAGRASRRWLEALGELEALCALAGLRFDEPEWCYPVIDATSDSVTGTSVGHPLIAEARRISNDVTVGPAGTFLLVTGSNMSGKSTMLRAIGLNVVLAQAGAPVCASSFVLPPVELATSIVIEDSLVDGVSFFMAELRRLREIVTLADACRDRGERRLLYLLDEILRGTNAIERQIAARRVITHLLAAGAIGAVSTHDTGLAAIDEIVRASVPVHFQETIETDTDGGSMTFDYKLHPGLATTTNALKLLELVGLGNSHR